MQSEFKKIKCITVQERQYNQIEITTRVVISDNINKKKQQDQQLLYKISQLLLKKEEISEVGDIFK